MVTVKPGFADTTETSQKTREDISDKCLPQETKKKKKRGKRKKTRRSPIEKRRKKGKNSANEKEWRARLSWKADLSSHTTRYAEYKARGRIDADHMLIDKI